eukprot:gnl/Hemi2/1380_TR485_c0_g5_i1.p2 gnl/Hemi2/1380_TR485_c0_g5~~gnl/Hemi2/1380_TR485_c0_g5_i1.p2  ORF type:complete len:162 (-),score=27.37 gnl/Hemi2/1380_TR485_c0_g5_i1:1165-1617(-)
MKVAIEIGTQLLEDFFGSFNLSFSEMNHLLQQKQTLLVGEASLHVLSGRPADTFMDDLIIWRKIEDSDLSQSPELIFAEWVTLLESCGYRSVDTVRPLSPAEVFGDDIEKRVIVFKNEGDRVIHIVGTVKTREELRLYGLEFPSRRCDPA